MKPLTHLTVQGWFSLMGWSESMTGFPDWTAVCSGQRIGEGIAQIVDAETLGFSDSAHLFREHPDYQFGERCPACQVILDAMKEAFGELSSSQ